jgi:hypothetical protein
MLSLIKAAWSPKLKQECATIRLRFGVQRREPIVKIARKMRDPHQMVNKGILEPVCTKMCQDYYLRTRMERLKIRKSIKRLLNREKKLMESQIWVETNMLTRSSITSLPALTILLQATQVKAQLEVIALDRTHVQSRGMTASSMSLKMQKWRSAGWLQIRRKNRELLMLATIMWLFKEKKEKQAVSIHQI